MFRVYKAVLKSEIRFRRDGIKQEGTNDFCVEEIKYSCPNQCSGWISSVCGYFMRV